ERIGNRAVTRCAAGKPRRLADVGAGHEALDALVDVAEPLLQPHDGLAVGGEAEMAGLDDAGMDGADGNLMQAVSFGREKRRGLPRPLGSHRDGRGPANAPASRVEPWTLTA